MTRASGKSMSVTHRRVKNQPLAAVGYLWAFAALSASPGARAHYDRGKAAGDRHTAAQRNLFNRLLGCLHHCLDTRQHYNEHIASLPTTTQPKPQLDKLSAWDVYIARDIDQIVTEPPSDTTERCAAASQGHLRHPPTPQGSKPGWCATPGSPCTSPPPRGPG